jgi:hypothetical protein
VSAADAILAQAATQAVAEQLYVLRPAWEVTFSGDRYVTQTDARAKRLPEWQAALEQAEKVVAQWLGEGEVET